MIESISNDELLFRRETLAFMEKIALSELETSKAQERTKELQYQHARYNLEFFLHQSQRLTESPK